MRRTLLLAPWLVAGLASACATSEPTAPSGEAAPEEVKGLKTAAAFASIEDEATRARALFAEAGKVLTHARCVNCHPAGDRPRQTDGRRLHEPPVVRGEDGHGAVGMRCATCHTAENVALVEVTVPGHRDWHLAPRSMAWEGRTLAEICAQVKDEARNGGRDLDALAHHMAEDGLVGWAWAPGEGLTPAPGTQAVFGGLIRAWADAGAHCPP